MVLPFLGALPVFAAWMPKACLRVSAQVVGMKPTHAPPAVESRIGSPRRTDAKTQRQNKTKLVFAIEKARARACSRAQLTTIRRTRRCRTCCVVRLLQRIRLCAAWTCAIAHCSAECTGPERGWPVRIGKWGAWKGGMARHLKPSRCYSDRAKFSGVAAELRLTIRPTEFRHRLLPARPDVGSLRGFIRLDAPVCSSTPALPKCHASLHAASTLHCRSC